MRALPAFSRNAADFESLAAEVRFSRSLKMIVLLIYRTNHADTDSCPDILRKIFDLVEQYTRVNLNTIIMGDINLPDADVFNKVVRNWPTANRGQLWPTESFIHCGIGQPPTAFIQLNENNEGLMSPTGYLTVRPKFKCKINAVILRDSLTLQLHTFFMTALHKSDEPVPRVRAFCALNFV